MTNRDFLMLWAGMFIGGLCATAGAVLAVLCV